MTALTLTKTMELADPVQTNQALTVFWKPLRMIVPVTTPDFEVTGFKVTGPVDGAGRARALAEAKRAIIPALREQIKQALVRCAANCAIDSNESQEAKKLRWSAMQDELAEYPADLVLHAVSNWHKSNEWFPKTSQIIKRIQRETDARKSLVDCLERAPVRGERSCPDSKGRTYADLSDEEKSQHDIRSAATLEMLREAGKRMDVR